MISYIKKFIHSGSGYLVTVFTLVLLYLGFEFVYIPNASFDRDEFWFAHHIYQYLHYIPYRDFLPYKPVLGWYLLTPPMYFSHDILKPLFLIKNEIAFINACFIAFIAIWAKRLFKPGAILLTLLVIMCSQLFLKISSDLRVDMLSAWFALLSILLLLNQRSVISGIMLGVGFLISQKVLWYFAATNISYVIVGGLIYRNKEVLYNFIKFNLACLIVVSFYVVFWAHYSSLQIVLNSVFFEGYIQSKITWYQWMYYSSWQSILENGPLFVFLWPYTWIILFKIDLQKPQYQKRIFIVLYSSIMMLFVLSYQQSFAYNMIFLVPVFFVLYSEFFTWLEDSKIDLTQWRSVGCLTALSLWFILSLILIYEMHYCYLIILLIPILVTLLKLNKNKQVNSALKVIIGIVVLFGGIIYPLIYESKDIYNSYRRSFYQKFNISLANRLLENGDMYFAGTPILYNRDQGIPGLKNLIGPAINYLNNPKPEIKPILIESLYLTPRTPTQIIKDLNDKPVKLYVNNYRVELLPGVIRHYLANNYKHLWSAIYLYAPVIKAHQPRFSVKFKGQYRIEGKLPLLSYIDNKQVKNNQVLTFKNLHHKSNVKVTYRLVYIPSITQDAFDKAYQQYFAHNIGEN